MLTAVQDRPIQRQQANFKTTDRHSTPEQGLVESNRLRHFSLDEYQQLIEIGFFDEDERIELINGLLVEMSPINPRHAICIDKLSALLGHFLYRKAWLRIQSPITLAGRSSQPQPDVTIARLQPEKYETEHPSAEDVQLLIEVADSSLNEDRVNKLELYASGGISEYWIFNLVDNQLEVYREPYRSTAGVNSYNVKLIYARNQTLAPIAFPDCAIDLSEVLPKQ